jgi:hypothetical protein
MMPKAYFLRKKSGLRSNNFYGSKSPPRNDVFAVSQMVLVKVKGQCDYILTFWAIIFLVMG